MKLYTHTHTHTQYLLSKWKSFTRQSHKLTKKENNKKSTIQKHINKPKSNTCRVGTTFDPTKPKQTTKPTSNVPTSNLQHLTSMTAITLIALVITIIVLLILSAVTLNMVIGQNGIFAKANEAKEETKKSQALEDVRMKVLEAQTDKNGQATLADVVIQLREAKQDTYKVTTKSQVATLEEGSIPVNEAQNADAIYVTNQKYGYEIKVDKMLKVSITGETQKEESQKTYKITYNANGGEQVPEEQTKKWGEAIILSETKPTKTGYTFLNWNTKEDGTGKSYNVGESYIENEEVMLYAMWKINKYTVTYDRNFLPNNLYDISEDYSSYRDCSITFSKQTIVDDSVKKGKIGLFTPSQSTTQEGAGVYYPRVDYLTVGKTYTWSVYVKANREIKVKIGQEQGGYQYYNITNNWQRITKTYTAINNSQRAFIFYNAGEWNTDDKIYIHSLELQEGNLNTTTQTKEYNSTLGTLETPTRTGYTFNGWYTDPVGGTKIDENIKVNKDITYYAHWTYNG